MKNENHHLKVWFKKTKLEEFIFLYLRISKEIDIFRAILAFYPITSDVHKILQEASGL